MSTTLEKAADALLSTRAPLRYSVEVGRFGFWVRNVSGNEELSRPGRFELRFPLDPQSMRGDAIGFDPDEVVKDTAVVVLERESEVRRFTGVVTEARLSATATGVPEVLLVVESRLALLRHRRDVRIHRNQTVPEIVRDVCGALGVKVEWRLRDSYASRAYCVQWRETDFDYVSRLLEDEGIFYWFTDADVMVLGDNPDSYEATGTVLPHRAAAGESQNADAVHEIGSRAALVPGKVTLRDWNTEHPRLDMDVSAPTGGKTATEWYDYPGEYETPPEGIRKARLVAESFARQSAALTGTSSAGQLFPGSTFELVDTPVGADDGKVVVRKVTHDWHRTEQGFTVRFEADDARLTYRPPRETYVPTILNPLTGTVTTSSPSEDIHCDHFGRVKVHFHWDRLRPYDDDCSHWIPVLQDNTGGSSAIPRKDWEVLVHFMEGDPDRPVVLGRVYNGEDQFTEILPHSKTRSGLKSMTTPTRDGSNEIRFDDLAGSEQIFVHAERDQTIEIANNRTEDVWNTQASAVKNDESITVGNDAKWEIGKDMTPRVDNDQSWDVGGDRKLEIGANEVDTVALDRTIDIGGNYEITAGFSEATGAKKLTEKIGGSMLEEYKTMHTSEVGDTLDLVVKGSLLENAKQSKVEAANVHKKETISGMALTATGGEVKMRFDQYRHTKVGGFVMATAKKELTLTGASKFMTVSPTATYTGAADITLKVKDTVVLMKDGLIKIKSPQKVSLLISGNANEGASISTQI